MAKRGSRSDFNMAKEIRELLTADPTMTGPQVVEALKKKFPGKSINSNSASVAFAGARKKLGITKSKKVRRRRPGTPVGSARRESRPAATSAAETNLEILKAARDLLKKCKGDQSTAAIALKGVAALQID